MLAYNRSIKSAQATRKIDVSRETTQNNAKEDVSHRTWQGKLKQECYTRNKTKIGTNNGVSRGIRLERTRTMVFISNKARTNANKNNYYRTWLG